MDHTGRVDLCDTANGCNAIILRWGTRLITVHLSSTMRSKHGPLDKVAHGPQLLALRILAQEAQITDAGVRRESRRRPW
jgi:hypothetical protein